MSRPSLALPILTLLTALSMISLGTGCASTSGKPTEPATPMSADSLDQMRASFKASDPNVKVGQVSEVMDGYAAISEVSAADFPIGSVVSIIDGNSNVLANATVVKSVEGGIHVKLSPKTGARPAAVGDAAVKFSS